MGGNEPRGAPSTANILGHPVHPMLIPFPIAFLVGAFVSDLVHWGAQDLFWAQASFWLIGAGLALGLLAGVVGAVDFFTIGRARAHADGWIHAGGNLMVIVLAVVNLLLRVGSPNLSGGLLVAGTLLSAMTSALLVITGWYGGELAYRHLVGVVGPPETSETGPR